MRTPGTAGHPKVCVRSRERGAGTVLTAGIGMALLILLAATALLIQATVAASRAATAADLSALAAADAARGLLNGDPCGIAAETSAQHGARMSSCIRLGGQGHIVEVRTAVDTPGLLPDATGRARAGPPPSRAAVDGVAVSGPGVSHFIKKYTLI